MQIVTSSWFVQLPDQFCRIGISRGTPRGQPAGYRMYRKLAPGPWFNSVSAIEYRARYQDEVLCRLDPVQTRDELLAIAGGKIPALLCFEPPEPGPKWCHRSLVAAWFGDCLSLDVFEFGREQDGSGWSHPKLCEAFRRQRSFDDA